MKRKRSKKLLMALGIGARDAEDLLTEMNQLAKDIKVCNINKLVVEHILNATQLEIGHPMCKRKAYNAIESYNTGNINLSEAVKVVSRQYFMCKNMVTINVRKKATT